MRVPPPRPVAAPPVPSVRVSGHGGCWACTSFIFPWSWPLAQAPCMGYSLRCLLSPFLPAYGSCLSNATSQLIKACSFLIAMPSGFDLKFLCNPLPGKFNKGLWSSWRSQSELLPCTELVKCMHLYFQVLLQGKGSASLTEPWYCTFMRVGTQNLLSFCYISAKSLQLWKMVRVKMSHFVKRGWSILKDLISVHKITW